jgi:hypothetical protein
VYDSGAGGVGLGDPVHLRDGRAGLFDAVSLFPRSARRLLINPASVNYRA